jgi:hypothetical protein
LKFDSLRWISGESEFEPLLLHCIFNSYEWYLTCLVFDKKLKCVYTLILCQYYTTLFPNVFCANSYEVEKTIQVSQNVTLFNITQLLECLSASMEIVTKNSYLLAIFQNNKSYSLMTYDQQSFDHELSYLYFSSRKNVI